MSDLIARLLNPAYECQLGVARLAEKQTRQDMDEAANRIKELEANAIAPLPPCMMPDGGECCPQYHAAIIRIKELEAELSVRCNCVSMLILCGEEGGIRKGEQPMVYLRRLIDALIEAQTELDSIDSDRYLK